MLEKITKQIRGRRTRRPLRWCGQPFLALKTNKKRNKKRTTLLNDSFNSARFFKIYIFLKQRTFSFLHPMWVSREDTSDFLVD